MTDTKQAKEETNEKLSKILWYCHLFSEKEKGIITSIKVTLSNKIVNTLQFKEELQRLIALLFKNANIKYHPHSVHKTLHSPALSDNAKIRSLFDDREDIYVKASVEAIPIAKENEKEEKKDIVLSYIPISNYSFYVASETFVRVLVPIPGIDKVKKEDIITKFTEDSWEIKVNNAWNGLNYRFAVPRLDAKIIPEKCDTFVKGDKLNIRLRKFKNDDHWSYLFKQKYVGE